MRLSVHSQAALCCCWCHSLQLLCRVCLGPLASAPSALLLCLFHLKRSDSITHRSSHHCELGDTPQQLLLCHTHRDSMLSMMRRCALIILIGVTLLTIPHSSHALIRTAADLHNGTLTLLMTVQPPFILHDSSTGAITGLCIDLLELVLERMRVASNGAINLTYTIEQSPHGESIGQ